MIKLGRGQSRTMNVNVKKMTTIGVLGAISIVLGLTPLGFIPVGPTRATIMHIPVIIGAIIEGPLVGAMVGLIFGLFSILNAIMNPTPVSFVFLNPLVSVVPRVLIGITAYYSYTLFAKMGKKASVVTLSLVWIGTLYYLFRDLIIKINNIGNISITMIMLTGLLLIITLSIGYFAYKKLKSQAIEVVTSAAVGTLTNTIGVLSMIYFLYAEEFVAKIGADTATTGKVIMGIGILNGIPEIIIAMIIVTSVVVVIKNRL